jgi:hypothetical protein
MNRIVYFSKMFQAVPHLAQVQCVLPGTFITNRRSTLQAVQRLYPEMSMARYSRFLGPLAAGNRELKRADIIVTGSPYRSFLQPYLAKKCTVFHGTYMLLSKEALLQNRHFDLLCVIGPRMQQMIQRFDPEVQVKCEATGFLPFCEFPGQSAEQRSQALSGMGLDPECKTIIYTPSRRGIGSWTLVAEQLVSTTPAHFNLVLRPHPSQALTSRSQDRTSFRRVAVLAAKRPRTLLDLTSYPLPVLQSVADLVVSDANSPAEESLFYDVPQLFIETAQFSQDVLRKMAERENMHPDDTQKLLTLYECGLRQRVDVPTDFAPLLERAIDDAAAFSHKRQQYFSWVFGERDRLANQRVAKAIQTHLFK